ncbi:methyltransferase domain-containing protein [Candidatus Bipolaricaulota bacterium]|nr:methyltransferase domain-containing protein [Candidatus Bipolaricaulota bacterium]
MYSYLMEMLECPACHGALSWDVSHQQGDRIVEAVARCGSCEAEYPIREGIGVFLTPDLPRNDLWEEGERFVAQMISDYPEIEAQLMGVPLSELGPADRFICGMVHEECEQWDQAQLAFDSARLGLYTDEYNACQQSQITYLLEEVADEKGPIVDLASGRCALVKKLIEGTERPIVATDFSLRVLRRNRAWLTHHNLYDRLSLLAFDARRTPFRDHSIDTMTTFVGLPNIEQPGSLLKELWRVVSGRFLAISQFYPATDAVNLAALREYGLEDSMLLEPALNDFRGAGWDVSIRNLQRGLARPTPRSALIPDQGIDGLPIAETTLDWCVLEAT